MAGAPGNGKPRATRLPPEAATGRHFLRFVLGIGSSTTVEVTFPSRTVVTKRVPGIASATDRSIAPDSRVVML
jgi:hypothetical protein